MSTIISFVLTMSCLVPALYSVIKFKKTDECYTPFLWLMIAALISELIGALPIVISHNYDPASYAYPLYTLVELYLLLLFFRRNNIFNYNKTILIVVICTIIVYFIAFIFKKNIKNDITGYCNVFSRIIIIIFSVRMMSNEVFEIRISPFKNPKMIIAFSCILFYSFDLLQLIFDFMNTKHNLYPQIFLIHQIANVTSYIIFTWAIIWIPVKAKY